MKTRYILSSFLMLLFVSNINAQNIPNSSFENWRNDTAYQNPSGMNTFNLESFAIQRKGNTIRSTDSHSGNYSAKLTTITNGSTVLPGFVGNGNFQGTNFIGGVPFTQTPDTAYVWVKYMVQPGDTAAVGFFIKKLGTTFAEGYVLLTGNQTTWTKISIPINYYLSLTPDSLIFGVASSYLDMNTISGTEIYVDDVHFNSGITTIPNAGFESWSTSTYESPDHWFTYSYLNLFLNNTYIEKSTDSYDGAYAIKLNTRILGTDTMAFFSNGDLIASEWNSGQGVSGNPMKITGYYKYSPVGGDTAVVALRTTRWDPTQGKTFTVQENMKKLPPTNVYSFFEVMLSYDQYPPVDTLQLAFASSNLITGHANAKDGSSLWIDSLNLTYFPMSINDNGTKGSKIKVYPNPASDIINFQFQGDLMSTQKNIIIYDVQSKKVYEFSSSASLYSMDISQFDTGLYFYMLESENKIYQGKFSVR